MDLLFKLDRDSKRGLQNQLKDQISAAIIEGRILPGASLPSSRKLAENLGVARNTVVLAYSALQDDGFVTSRQGSGFYVNTGINVDRVQFSGTKLINSNNENIDWDRRFAFRTTQERRIIKPSKWRDFNYCFIYGQNDQSLFPLRHWRECWRDAVGVQEVSEWSQDLIDRDDPLLIQQIQTRLLPRRGLWVEQSQILVTLGAQNAIYIALRLLLNKYKCFGLEDPGYPDARNIASMFTQSIKLLKTDNNGLKVDQDLSPCDLIYVTPSHQSPTTVTLPEVRRRELLQKAEEHDFLLIEDDYEAETNFTNKPLPALMSYDENGRVIYIGSLSKTLAPGLRLGFLVGPAAFIREARALRRLLMGHPPANNQRAAAYFLSRGHHESLLRRLVKTNQKKRQNIIENVQKYLPEWSISPNRGGSSIWVTGPPDLDARVLAKACLKKDVLIEPGAVHYGSDDSPFNNLRLGYTSILLQAIEPGIKLIAETLKEISN